MAKTDYNGSLTGAQIDALPSKINARLAPDLSNLSAEGEEKIRELSGTKELAKIVEDNEKVTAAALVELNNNKADKEDIPEPIDISGKQDVISDLDDIRRGAGAGATALQASDKGVVNGVASLDGSGKVPSSQLPSYVDDVLEFESEEALPSEGESGKIYVTTNDNKTYRWSGSMYVEIAKSPFSVVDGEVCITYNEE